MAIMPKDEFIKEAKKVPKYKNLTKDQFDELYRISVEQENWIQQEMKKHAGKVKMNMPTITNSVQAISLAVDANTRAIELKYVCGDLMDMVRSLNRKLEEANNLIKTLRDGNLDLIEQVRKAKQEKIRFVQIRPSKSLQDELYELYEMVETLQKENDAIRGVYDDVDEMKQTVETANQICTEYEEENKQLKLENQKLNGKIHSLEIQINSYKDREANKQIPLLYRGTEEDKYSGESKDMILECLQDKLKTLDVNFRSYAVIKSIIEANPIDGTRMKIRKDLETFLLNYGKLATADGNMHLLTRNGLEVHAGSNHGSIGWKGDSRFNTSISSTPSDKVRGNLNQYTTISRMLL